ncbi:methyltransferase domain-containing protein [Pedobacter antarcticus]|uniref:methyltransferase domain-containing protein n=1 Tax=Pedobacter antarcticus TaxID=34086 RepID=UPI001C58C544|nr:methyltransferase domain-containing protein [Pedobacter antarcticus]
MAWNPQKYNEFKAERFAPFADIIKLISKNEKMKVLDLGCGTGELTRKLADELSESTVLGIDSSAEMLDGKDGFSTQHVNFKVENIDTQLNSSEKWDLIFSHAALQWVDDHARLFPALLKKLNPGGQIAIQMPSQNENVLNQLLLKLVQEHPYAAALKNWKRISPVLTLDDYTRILFEHQAKNLTVFQKVYPIIANNHQDLYEFISGSALIPYMERLDPGLGEAFITEFKKRIEQHYKKMPAIYAFKRIILYAQF